MTEIQLNGIDFINALNNDEMDDGLWATYSITDPSKSVLILDGKDIQSNQFTNIVFPCLVRIHGTVHHHLKFINSTFPYGLEFIDTIFKNDVEITSCDFLNFGFIHFHWCSFLTSNKNKGSIKYHRVNINKCQNLSQFDLSTNDEDEDSGPVTVNIDHVKINQDLRITDGIFNSIKLTKSPIGGDLEIFKNINILESLSLKESNIEGNLKLSEISVKGRFDFKGIAVKGYANFENSDFYSEFDFSEATFGKMVELTGANFYNELKTPLFTSSIFNSGMTLTDTKFLRVPNFLGATFNNPVSISRTRIKYQKDPDKPELLSIPIDPGDQDLYRKLKSMAIEARDHESEQLFFANELKSKREYGTLNTSLSMYLSLAYEFFSNFGRSIAKPFFILLAIWIIFASIYFEKITERAASMTISFGDSLLFSASVILPFWSTGKDWRNTLGIEQEVFTELGAFMFFQNIFSFCFLFLLGLGIRNRFKL